MNNRQKIISLRLGILCLILSIYKDSQANPITNYQMLDSSSYYYEKGDFLESIKWCERALSKSKKIKDENGIMQAHLEMGNSLFYAVNYVDAIKNYFSCLKIAEKRKNKTIQSNCYNYIANIYYARSDFQKAKEYYQKSINTDPEEGLTAIKSSNYGYLAGIFYNLQQFDSSKYYYEKTIIYYSAKKDSINLILMQQNLASVYAKLGQVKKAQEMMEAALKISLRTKNPSEIGYSYFTLGLFHAENNENKKALESLHESLKTFKSINDYAYMSNTCFALSETYQRLKMYKEALEYFRDHKIFLDSTQNSNLTKEIATKEVKFQMEKQQLADSLKRAVVEKENQIRTDEKIKRQSIYMYAGAGGFMLMLILAIVLFRSNRNKQKANNEISLQKKEVELQKLIIEIKQKEIIDSIQYAKRIQLALLPSTKYIARQLARHREHSPAIEKNLNNSKK